MTFESIEEVGYIIIQWALVLFIVGLLVLLGFVIFSIVTGGIVL